MPFELTLIVAPRAATGRGRDAGLRKVQCKAGKDATMISIFSKLLRVSLGGMVPDGQLQACLLARGRINVVPGRRGFRQLHYRSGGGPAQCNASHRSEYGRRHERGALPCGGLAQSPGWLLSCSRWGLAYSCHRRTAIVVQMQVELVTRSW